MKSEVESEASPPQKHLKPCHPEEQSDVRVALSLHVAQTLPRSSRGAVVGESIEPYKCGEGSSFVSCRFSKNVIQLTIQEPKAFAK